MSIFSLGAFEIPTQSTENVGAASATGSKISGSADQLPVPAGSSIGKESKKHKKGNFGVGQYRGKCTYHSPP